LFPGDVAVCHDAQNKFKYGLIGKKVFIFNFNQYSIYRYEEPSENKKKIAFDFFIQCLDLTIEHFEIFAFDNFE